MAAISSLSVRAAAPRAAVARTAAPPARAVPASGFLAGRPLRPSLKVAPQAKKFVVRAEQSEGLDTDKLIKDLTAKWDAVENKSGVAVYAGGAVVLLWFSSTIIGAINNVPILPKIMELVGLGYTGWFVYRYLLFKSSREELVSDVEDLKKKITGPQ
mmetsp:Transcript_14023/g.23823  ORF Transcript_14023/g.23823 Transcript_14023/m.23823 type:complete len:157 (+) Transcript_14023:131-601(+)|eukprot:CAMPEP_0177773526 /NCGR_PEP_ID=MMETSP0491_2-20121128/12927_1 /TAXON_ID=63592 /ORGANISM="Tetraselmis chuii, Strain PLY429" /LENGTH=156 /DNA_ID=CAMNT_0019291657 /DNA_START=95 /DNA_END=565 /DNA_ORIENTATION=+